MPRQHFPTSRRRRRPGIVGVALLGSAAAIALSLALPATMPRGDVLDLVTDNVGPRTAAGQEPAAAASGVAKVATPVAIVPIPDIARVPVLDTASASTPLSDVRGYDFARSIAQAADVAPPGPPAVKGLARYAWPIAQPRITLPFGATPWGTFVVDGERFHDGIDIATFCGDRIMAAHDGTVLAAGRHFDDQLGWVGSLRRYYGRLDAKHLWWELPLVVVIDDGNGYRSVYAHFGELRVQRGDKVRAGQLLGFEGATGHATGCHLHYGLFSPAETATYKLNAATAKRMKLPRYELARIDPFKVLPPRPRPAATASGATDGAP